MNAAVLSIGASAEAGGFDGERLVVLARIRDQPG